MLDAAIPGEQYSKAGLIRQAQGTVDATPFGAPFYSTLAARSRGSIEFKLMNATAAHRDLDAEAITMDGYGYRAMPNYQATLKDAMALKIETRRRCFIDSQGKNHAQTADDAAHGTAARLAADNTRVRNAS
jgi:hypothetical protein